MSQLFTFSESDQCPDKCYDKGGFVKVKDIENQEVIDQKNVVHKINFGQDSEEQGTEKAFNKQQDLVMQGNPYSDTKMDHADIIALSGIGPNVSKHSIKRYTLRNWRKHNEKMLDSSVISDSHILNYNGQTTINAAFGNMDQAQLKDTNLLINNAKGLYKWKVEVELACKAIAEEVKLLEMEKQRVRDACRALLLPEAISKECSELRSSRAETELVADLAERELEKEMELISEVREFFRSALGKIDEQLSIDKAAKHRIEYEWCDKTTAYANEANNLSFSINSNTIMFKHGAVKFGHATAPLSYWEYFCRNNIINVEAVRQTSEDLRSTVNSLLVNNGKNLRNQADRTDKAFAETIALTSELVTKLEEHVKYVLQSLAEVELLIKHLQDCILKSDRAMKLAQTRLDNRNTGRPHGENVRDKPHIGLLNEVKVIHGTAASLLAQLKNAEKTRKKLMAKRLELEKEIAAKRKSLSIDRERCGLIRSYYPTASELSGL
ncbi:unnamed protein product [Arctia plantaginis]|uniref:Tektin n=1 Tax=Arctia plantaginis TaxID=874455 RepID=A0A8S0Z190_ARCPL|nr:unnamed protein product [Arctia plantaginis]